MNPQRRRAILWIGILCTLLAGGVFLLIRESRDAVPLAHAQTAISQRDFVSAGKLLDEHLARFPRDQFARLLAAQTARRRGDADAARRHLEAYERQGGPADAVRLERELMALQRGNLDDSLRLLAFCKEHPQASEVPFVLESLIEGNLNVLNAPYAAPAHPADQSLPAGYSIARTAIEFWFARELEPVDRVQGLVWRARQRELGGEHAAALDDLRQALELDGRHVHARFLSAIFLAQENPIEARAQLEQLIADHPGDPRFLFPYSTMLRATGRFDEANQALDQMPKPDQDSAQVLLERGLILLDKQKPSEAEVFLHKALARNDQDADAVAAMIRCLRQLGRTDDAARYQERFLQLERKRQDAK